MAELVVFQLTREEQVSLSDDPHTGILSDHLYLTRDGAQLAVAQQIQRLGYQPAEPEWTYDPDKTEWGMKVSGLYYRIRVRPVRSTPKDDIENAPVDRMGKPPAPDDWRKAPGSARKGLSFDYSLRNTGAALLFLVAAFVLAVGLVTVCAQTADIACRALGYC